MKFTKFLVLISLATLALAFPHSSDTCSEPAVRQEWRTLSKTDQLSYIEAVKCLQSLPGETQNLFSGVRNRFDDFQALHINLTDTIHFVGLFQPWHRLFTATYEDNLREKCGWKKGQPYWDWSLDAVSEKAFLKSPVFDAKYGFGGNGPYINSTNDTSVRLHIPGKTGGGCVEDGPFVNMSVNMGPGLNNSYNPRCLTRDFSPWLATQKLNASLVEWTLRGSNFSEFDIRVQGAIDVDDLTYHGGGHLSVGGDLGVIGDVYASPGDPLFFFHHANMDRLWDKWQRYDFPVRSKDISGPITQFGYPFDFFGYIPTANVTLDTPLNFRELIPGAPTVNISEVMDIRGGRLCYLYV